MVVLTKMTLANFLRDYPQANEAIYKWYKTVENADWSNFNELRQDFNSADAVEMIDMYSTSRVIILG